MISDYTLGPSGESDWSLDYSGPKLPMLMPMPAFAGSQMHIPMPTLYSGTGESFGCLSALGEVFSKKL